jgi:hypothetical protein
MAYGMEAQDHFGACGTLDAQALGADWNAAIGADLDRGANAPNIRPTRATGDRAQNGATFFPGAVPSLVRGHTQLAMGFVGVVI